MHIIVVESVECSKGAITIISTTEQRDRRNKHNYVPLLCFEGSEVHSVSTGFAQFMIGSFAATGCYLTMPLLSPCLLRLLSAVPELSHR